MPEYNNYGHLPPNMNTQMPHFQGYHHLDFHHNFPPQTHPINHNPPWNNGMLPMNLNLHNEHNIHMEAYHQNYDKRQAESLMIKEQTPSSKVMPLNIPQIQTKAFHKQTNMSDNSYYGEHYNNCYESNLDLRIKPDRFQMDETRRKSLENTVKLIENILNNSTAKREAQASKLALKETGSLSSRQTVTSAANLSYYQPPFSQPPALPKQSVIQTANKKLSIQTDKSAISYAIPRKDNEKNLYDDCQVSNLSAENLTLKDADGTREITQESFTHTQKATPNESTKSNDNKSLEERAPTANSFKVSQFHTEVQEESNLKDIPETSQNLNENTAKMNETLFMDVDNSTHEENEGKKGVEELMKTVIVDSKQPNDPLKDEDDSDHMEDVKPNIQELSTEYHTVAHVVVKLEKDDNEEEMDEHFTKDRNGVRREDVEADNEIIDAERSITEATEAIKNGQHSRVYYECPHCNLLLSHPKRLLIHVKWHTFGLKQSLKEEERKMKQMRRSERREARVVELMNSKEVTEQEIPEGKTFPCRDCDKIFSTKGSLKNHKQRLHPPRNRECRICQVSIPGWSAMRAHVATHAIQTSEGFQCTDCPKKFKYMHSLVKHKGTHMEKTHPCPECPKLFGSQILVKMHMKSHERAQRGATFHCTYCGKGFFEAYNLSVHERTHRNERPFACDICNTSFGTKSSLKRHLKVSHNSLKPFECPECHRCFVSEGIRDRHLSRNHGKPEDFKFPCTLCPCKYLKLKDLQKHEYKAHPKKGKRKRKVKEEDEPKIKMDEDDMSD